MRLLTLVFLLPACIAPRPVNYTATPDAGYCAPNIGPHSPDDACDARYTPDGMSCALCSVTRGCVARDLMIYCVQSCSDPACGVGKRRR